MTGTSDRCRGTGARVGGRRIAVPAGEVARLYRLGLTMTEIAGIYHVTAWVIGSRLDQAGVARRAAGSRAGLPVDKAVRRYRRQPGLLAELAAELGISAQLIVDRAARPASADRGHGTYRADVRPQDVADLYRAGWTVGQIAGRYQVAAATILCRLDSAGTARRPASLPAPFPAGEAARRVREEGASFAGLAREYGVSAGAVGYQMAARGVPAAVHAPRVLCAVPPEGIARLYEDGLTVAEIAALHQVSRWVIAARLDAAGVARRPRGKPLPVAEAAGLYRDGDSLAALAARYGVSARTVWGKLTAAGIGLRPPGGRRIAVPVGEAVELYEAGHTMARLAGRYGVCETVIYNRLTEAGAPIRRRAGNFKQVDTGLLAGLARQIGLGGAAMTGSPEAAWLGYTFRELHQIAVRAAVYCRWGDRFGVPERFEIAWSGVVDHLAGCEQPPDSFDLYKAGQRAISRASDRELREHGITRGGDGLQAMPSFDAYWGHKTSPAADAAVVDRLAVWQIWPMLRPLHQMAFLALAAHGDYSQAADAVGYPYNSFSALITAARAEFLRLWHEGETPSRIWAADRHGSTDPALRARRVLAARRRNKHEHPPGTGPAPVQATA